MNTVAISMDSNVDSNLACRVNKKRKKWKENGKKWHKETTNLKGKQKTTIWTLNSQPPLVSKPYIKLLRTGTQIIVSLK